ncbi:glycoside hydrolase [Rossellomorea sp. SC111]|uniref:WD40/YVTN/BNR-like repeat-containing protein n=1 Tax=Rossellomorea sp. SC111 TaxID=2968985 RepID=UPI00215ADEAB|nr:glycoside hydrolase [Rossellomorea sp. SC111]MCR8849307.1 glycoside hydrolase [Rossellomorea sp. SC111]
MKYIMIGTACLMVIGIIAGTYFFEKEPNISQPATPELTDPGPPPLQALNEAAPVGYSLQEDQLQITYNHGEKWIQVPVEKENLFQGEYSGSEDELIEESYILTEDLAAFLYARDYSVDKSVRLLFSKDKGETWEDAQVTASSPPIRFRKVGFLNESFGYVILSADRTMSQELTTVYLTKDGGESWQETASPDTMRLIDDGGFVDEDTGFLSFGILNPEEPDLHLTHDGGNSWNKAAMEIPDQYKRIFVMAEVPFKEGDHLAAYVNQGPNGDYKGGKIKGKFISEDQGRTWSFQEEVQPDETD